MRRPPYILISGLFILPHIASYNTHLTHRLGAQP